MTAPKEGASDQSTQCSSPPQPKGTPLLYSGIRAWFRFCAAGFYATTEVHGIDNVPANGVPTILCFNHGNGLGDPLVLIRKTPRMVRFCAKDTLWSVPIMKYFIRNSGAVPVYRAREHGDKAKDMNLEIFRKVIGALREGDCLGFAPEGVSRFLPYMEQPLKTGVARIAIDAVQQASAAGDPTFAVKIVPVGLTYTHREKFRSDLCMRYVAPLTVDTALLSNFKAADGTVDTYACAKVWGPGSGGRPGSDGWRVPPTLGGARRARGACAPPPRPTRACRAAVLLCRRASPRISTARSTR